MERRSHENVGEVGEFEVRVGSSVDASSRRGVNESGPRSGVEETLGSRGRTSRNHGGEAQGEAKNGARDSEGTQGSFIPPERRRRTSGCEGDRQSSGMLWSSDHQVLFSS